MCENTCGYYEIENEAYAWVLIFIFIGLLFCSLATCRTWGYEWYYPDTCTCRCNTCNKRQQFALQDSV